MHYLQPGITEEQESLLILQTWEISQSGFSVPFLVHTLASHFIQENKTKHITNSRGKLNFSFKKPL